MIVSHSLFYRRTDPESLKGDFFERCSFSVYFINRPNRDIMLHRLNLLESQVLSTQNMARNLNSYDDKYIRKHRKRHSILLR